MKKFYAMMVVILAMLIGSTGCGEGDPAPEYGAPLDEDTVMNDENLTDDLTDDQINDIDVEEVSDDVAQPEYGVTPTDYDTTDAYTEEVPDEPVVEYGAPPVDYDVADDSDVEENPDEITTDYGPISTKFKK